MTVSSFKKTLLKSLKELINTFLFRLVLLNIKTDKRNFKFLFPLDLLSKIYN